MGPDQVPGSSRSTRRKPLKNSRKLSVRAAATRAILGDKLAARLPANRLAQDLGLQPRPRPALGARIGFDSGNGRLAGTVLRRNRHTMTVKVEHDGVESQWRVPYHAAALLD